MNKSICRGQIYYIFSGDSASPVGAEMWSDRPGLIVSNDTNNSSSGAVEVVYLTSNLKKRITPTHIKVHSGDRMAVALCEQVYTVDKSRLGDLIDTLPDEELHDIDRALSFSLGINSMNYVGLFKKWEHYIKRYHLPATLDYERLASRSESETVEKQRRQIEILTDERNSYRTLFETTTKRLEELGDSL